MLVLALNKRSQGKETGQTKSNTQLLVVQRQDSWWKSQFFPFVLLCADTHTQTDLNKTWRFTDWLRICEQVKVMAIIRILEWSLFHFVGTIIRVQKEDDDADDDYDRWWLLVWKGRRLRRKIGRQISEQPTNEWAPSHGTGPSKQHHPRF